MDRSVSTSESRDRRFGANRNGRILAITAAIILIAAGAAAFFFTRQKQAVVPVTGNAANSSGAAASKPVELGAGYRLETGAQGGRITGPVTQAVSGDRVINLGAGFQLELNGSTRRVFAPAYPTATYQWVDIGPAYVIKMTVNNRQATVPLGLIKPSFPANQSQTVDLAGGYKLEIRPYGAAVMAPSGSEMKPQEQTPPARVIDVGGGYYLVLNPMSDQAISKQLNDQAAPGQGQANSSGAGKLLITLPNGLQIFAGETVDNTRNAPHRPSIAPGPSKTIYLGNGYWLIPQADGSRRVIYEGLK